MGYFQNPIPHNTPKYPLASPSVIVVVRSVRYIKTVNFGEGFGVFHFDRFKGFTVFKSSQPVFEFAGKIKVSVLNVLY